MLIARTKLKSQYAPSTFGKWVAAIADRHRGTGRDSRVGTKW
jgi:hypothetical protein